MALVIKYFVIKAFHINNIANFNTPLIFNSCRMKKIFKQQLYDYLFHILSKNNWDIDWDCEKELNALIEVSIDRVSHRDAAKEEMRQFAKTNLLQLLAYMHVDAEARGLMYLDANSIHNTFQKINALWPFKGMELRANNSPLVYREAKVFSTYY